MATNHTNNALLELSHIQQIYTSGQRRFTAVQEC